MSGPQDLRERAQALESAGRIVDAIAAWREALAAEPSPEHAYGLGSALLHTRQFEEAERLLSKARQDAPRMAAAGFRLGVLYYETDRMPEARATFEENLRLGEWAPTYVMLGWVYRRLGDDQAERAAFERAVSLDPANDEALYGLGIQLRRTDPQRAADLFRQAIAIDPDSAPSHRELGLMLWKEKRFEEAESEVRKSLALDYSNPWAHHYLANLLTFRSELDEAEKHLEVAVALWPEVPFALCDLGDVLARQGRLEEAEQAVRSALALEPGHQPSNLRLGQILVELDRQDEARPFLERAQAADPSSRRARQAREALDALDGEKRGG